MHGIYGATCVVCHEQFFGQTIGKFFLQDGHRTALIGTNQIVNMTKINWLCGGTIECFVASQRNYLHMKLKLLLL